MLVTILIVIALLLAIFLVIVALRPSEYLTTRSAALTAPPAAVFPHVNDLTRWPAWSPWQKLDPNIRYTYSGPASGKDAGVHWKGNSKAGEGRMTITESAPVERITMRVEFIKPFASACTQEFTFDPQSAGGTYATWSMHGKANFMMKAMGLFMDCDKLVGKDFEEGLANLNRVTGGKP